MTGFDKALQRAVKIKRASPGEDDEADDPTVIDAEVIDPDSDHPAPYNPEALRGPVTPPQEEWVNSSDEPPWITRERLGLDSGPRTTELRR